LIALKEKSGDGLFTVLFISEPNYDVLKAKPKGIKLFLSI
jgi:hypothetical protein